MYSSQSGSITGWSTARGVCCTLHVSNMSSARLRFLPELMLMVMASSRGHAHCSLLDMSTSAVAISSSVGAGTLMPRQRDRRGAITFERELQMRMMRHCAEYLHRRRYTYITYRSEIVTVTCHRTYFSMVLLKLACACFDKRSTSVKMTTLNPLDDVLLP